MNKYYQPITTFRFSIDARSVADQFERVPADKPVMAETLRSSMQLVIKKTIDLLHFEPLNN